MARSTNCVACGSSTYYESSDYMNYPICNSYKSYGLYCKTCNHGWHERRDPKNSIIECPNCGEGSFNTSSSNPRGVVAEQDRL